MAAIRCFMLQDTGHQRNWLRRYEGSPCLESVHKYHDTRILLGDTPQGIEPIVPQDLDWPTTCIVCGFVFPDDTPKQMFNQNLYQREDTGEVIILQDAPPGAMWYCPDYLDSYTSGYRDWPELGQPNSGILSVHYFRDHFGKRDPLTVVCPDGKLWVIDAPSSSGMGWATMGDAPNITASPSINTGTYHGFLQNGFFSDPL